MEMQIFKNSSFGEVRVAGTSEEPLFYATDICKILDYSNPSKAIKDHVDEDDRYNESLERGGSVVLINESGLFSLILRSNKPEAKQFRKWVTSEVLPSIRKHGAYATAPTIDNIIANPDFGIKLLQNLKEEHQKRLEAENYSRTLEIQSEEQSRQLKLSAPKVRYCDDVLSSTGFITVNMIAQGIGISAIKLNKILEQWGIQYKQSGCYFLYAEYRDKGFATQRPIPCRGSNGEPKTVQHLYWTEKGRAFIMSKFNSKTSTALGK